MLRRTESKSGRFRRKVRVQPDMNVTPLVDVVLVLLIIFMVLAPVVSSAFAVRLPPKDEKDEQLEQANDADSPLVLIVRGESDYAINNVELAGDELPQRLSRMFNARKDRVLYMDARNRVEYGTLLTAMDRAREGGAQPIVLMTKQMD